MIIDTEQLREKLIDEKERQKDVMNMRKLSVFTDIYYLDPQKNYLKNILEVKNDNRYRKIKKKIKGVRGKRL